MNKMLAVIVASVFALGSVSGYAADGAKTNGATAPAAATAAPAKTDAKSTTKATKQGVKKDKVSRSHAKKARRAA